MKRQIIECDLCGKPNIGLNNGAHEVKVLMKDRDGKWETEESKRAWDVCVGCWAHIKEAVDDCKKIKAGY